MSRIFTQWAATAAALSVFAAVAVSPLALHIASPALARLALERVMIAKASGEAPLTLDVEIAKSDQEKAVGLMFRTELADTTGMLFPYGAEQDISMWMRNTYIPLDMLFIRSDGVIHRIEARTEPLSERVIAAGAPVSAVLELAGGAAERLGIKAGDTVLHPAIAVPGARK